MKSKIYYYISLSGANPVKDFINALENKQKVKIFHIFKLIIEYGINSIPKHIKKLSGTNLWEIRIIGKDNIRIIYIVPKFRNVLLLHGFVKKTNKTPLKEIKIASYRYNDWIQKNKNLLTNDII